jgi:NAD+ diphosphatase
LGALEPPAAEPIAFAGGVLDRVAARRHDEDWLAAARADPAARAVVAGREGVHAGRVPVRDATILLGVDEEGPLFAQAPAGEELLDLRSAAASLPPGEVGLLGYAAGMVHWHRTHAFCGTCGQPTEPAEGGFVRRCANGHGHHPRTDPVVIMLVVDREADRVLLGRQRTWPPGRYSALAGFVEPGESLEAAVAREVAEEAGVRVGEVRYVASQPWPFPASLMLGFEADWAGGEIQRADDELEDASWFSRAEVAQAAGTDARWEDGAPGGLLLPPRLAIARHLLEGWLARAHG